MKTSSIASVTVLLLFDWSAVGQEPILRPGVIDVVHDGSLDPPGDVVTIRPMLPSGEPVTATITVRPMVLNTVGDRELPAVIERNAGFQVRTEATFNARQGAKTAQATVPYSRMGLGLGTHRLVYEATVSVGGRKQFTQLSAPVTVEVGAQREIEETRRIPITANRMVTKSYEVIRDGRREAFTLAVPIQVMETRLETTGRRVVVPDGYRAVDDGARGDRTLATVSNRRIVYFATNRKVKQGVPTPRSPDDFQDASDAALRYGSAEVTIPQNHQRGDDVVEPAWYRSRNKAFQFTAFNNLSADRFRQTMSGSSEHDLLIFVHGYNTTFQFALFKTVQLAHDVGYKGRILTFSWASKGSLFSFGDDLEESRKAVGSFAALLKELKNASGEAAGKIHVLAHSMGSRVVCGAIGDASAADGDFPKLANVVLCAGEIDVGSYDAAFAKVIARCSRHSSYYHSRDRALTAAKEYYHTRATPPFPGYRPVGENPYLRSPPPCTDNIECNAADLGMLENLHGYYATSIPVLEDLKWLLVDGLDPNQRGLESQEVQGVKFWVIRP